MASVYHWGPIVWVTDVGTGPGEEVSFWHTGFDYSYTIQVTAYALGRDDPSNTGVQVTRIWQGASNALVGYFTVKNVGTANCDFASWVSYIYGSPPIPQKKGRLKIQAVHDLEGNIRGVVLGPPTFHGKFGVAPRNGEFITEVEPREITLDMKDARNVERIHQIFSDYRIESRVDARLIAKKK